MVNKKIKDIDIKSLKQAQGFMAVLDLLGITEDELLLIKDISNMKKEIESLRAENVELRRYMTNTAEGAVANKGKSIREVVQTFAGSVEDFNLNG